MRRRSRAGGEPVKTQRRKTAALRRGNAPKPVRRRGSSAADLSKKVALFKRERDKALEQLSEALEQQTATSEVLRVIASSRTDAQPAFEAMVARAARLCEADFSAVARFDNGLLHLVAMNNLSPGEREAFDSLFPRPPERNFAMGRAFIDGDSVQFEDVLADPTYDPRTRDVLQRPLGYRTFVAVPIIRNGKSIGTIGCGRRKVMPFTARQIALVQTFADQALIAVENVRLFDAEQQRTRELSESLQQQTATADVLKVISRSTFDLRAVLDTLVEAAARLCEADMAQILRPRDAGYYVAASYGFSPEYIESHKTLTFAQGRGSVTGRVLLERKPVQIPDVLADPEYSNLEPQRLGGYRTHLGVPLLRDGSPIGVLLVSRRTVQPFDSKQIELVTTFADQAVIAIENTRLFEDVQARTRELSESLEQQTATSEVLRVISSSPGDLKPVFEAMLTSAMRICAANFGHLLLYDGERYHAAYLHNLPTAYREIWERGPIRVSSKLALGRLAHTKQVIQITDIKDDPAYYTEHDPLRVAVVELGGARTFLAVPMLKEDQFVGAIVIYRQEIRPFTEKQIALVTSFAAQAVIAIENTRLLNELGQSLQQQTATADVLKVISHSTFDLQTVLNTLVESATRLCEAYDCVIFLRQGEQLNVRAHHGPIPLDFAGWPIRRGWVTGRAVIDRAPVHIHDLQASIQEFPDGSDMALRMGHRTNSRHPTYERERSYRRHHDPSYRVEAIHRQANRAGRHLRRPGSHRDRERAIVRRSASTHTRALPIGRGAPRARRGVSSSELDTRSRNGTFHHRRKGSAALRYRSRRHLRL